MNILKYLVIIRLYIKYYKSKYIFHVVYIVQLSLSITNDIIMTGKHDKRKLFSILTEQFK